MHMDFHHILIRHAHDGITDGLQVCLELCLVLLTELLLCHDDKFCTVSELDVRFRLFSRLHHLYRRSRFDRRIVHFFSLESIEGTVEHLYQTLSAGIHDAGFLQHREHLRRLCKDFLRIFDHLSEKDLQILCRLSHLLGFLSGSFGHGQDRALLRLHDSLVCRRSRTFACPGQHRGINLFILAYFLRKSAEKLGEDNARIASRAPQGSGRDRLCNGRHVRFLQRVYFFCRRHDRQCHICPRISVRHGKYIQLINVFFFCFQIRRSGKEHLLKHLRIYRFHSHDKILLNLSL